MLFQQPFHSMDRVLQWRCSAERHLTVEVYALYWHFVDAVWLFVFPIFVLSPHIR